MNARWDGFTGNGGKPLALDMGMDSRKTYWFWTLIIHDAILDISRAIVYNARMKEKYIQFRLWESTLKKLRRIYAETGESMIAIVDRLATDELSRIENATNQNVQVQTLPVEKE